MKRLAFALALGALLAPAAARADDGYRFELTPTAAYRWGGTISGRDNALTNFDLKVENSGAYGLTFDIPLSRNLQLELLANRQSTSLRFDQGLFGGDARVADIDIDYYHVGILWQFGNGQVFPYFVTTAGVTHLDPKVPGSSAEDRFSLSLGGGVKVFFNDHVGMRFEGRGFFTSISDYRSGCYDQYCDYYHHYNYDSTMSQGQASMGLILAW